MRKALTLSIIITIIGVALYFFKPSEEECIKKAQEEFQDKITYAIEASPKEIDKNLMAETLEKNFLESLEVKDKFLFRDIYQTTGGKKSKIGWAAFGWVNVALK